MEVLERFTIPSLFQYRLYTKSSSPFVPCDPRVVRPRFFFQEMGRPLHLGSLTTHDSDATQSSAAILVQYTIPGAGEPSLSTVRDGSENSRQGLVTTIVEGSTDDAEVSGFCTLSGRVVYSRLRHPVWLADVRNWDPLLVDVTLYDFLN